MGMGLWGLSIHTPVQDQIFSTPPQVLDEHHNVGSATFVP